MPPQVLAGEKGGEGRELTTGRRKLPEQHLERLGVEILALDAELKQSPLRAFGIGTQGGGVSLQEECDPPLQMPRVGVLGCFTTEHRGMHGPQGPQKLSQHRWHVDRCRVKRGLERRALEQVQHQLRAVAEFEQFDDELEKAPHLCGRHLGEVDASQAEPQSSRRLGARAGGAQGLQIGQQDCRVIGEADHTREQVGPILVVLQSVHGALHRGTINFPEQMHADTAMLGRLTAIEQTVLCRIGFEPQELTMLADEAKMFSELLHFSGRQRLFRGLVCIENRADVERRGVPNCWLLGWPVFAGSASPSAPPSGFRPHPMPLTAWRFSLVVARLFSHGNCMAHKARQTQWREGPTGLTETLTAAVDPAARELQNRRHRGAGVAGGEASVEAAC